MFVCMSDVSTEIFTDASTDADDEAKSQSESEKSSLNPMYVWPSSLESGLMAKTAFTSPKRRLNVNARLFTPMSARPGAIALPLAAPPSEPEVRCAPCGKGDRHFNEILTKAMRKLQATGIAAHLERSTEPCADFNIYVQDTGDTPTDELLLPVKQSLLEATKPSSYVKVMGFVSPNPFPLTPYGFQATLGLTERPKDACWHVFKKNFCRHEGNCNKRHPDDFVRVNMIVEAARLDAPAPVLENFEAQCASLASAVTTALKEMPEASMVEAFKSEQTKGWRIEASLDDDGRKECFESLAKTAMLAASAASESVYIMGYNAEPFLFKENGFMAVVGMMENEQGACWSFYEEGLCKCKRGGTCCAYEHPRCSMPINFVVRSHAHK